MDEVFLCRDCGSGVIKKRSFAERRETSFATCSRDRLCWITSEGWIFRLVFTAVVDSSEHCSGNSRGNDEQDREE